MTVTAGGAARLGCVHLGPVYELRVRMRQARRDARGTPRTPILIPIQLLDELLQRSGFGEVSSSRFGPVSTNGGACPRYCR